MACSNNRYRKSSVVAINSASQTFASTGTTLLPGSAVSVTGCSLSVAGSGIQVNSDGLYQIDAAVTFTPSAAGVVTVQIYKDGVLLPCTIRQMTVAADSVHTIDTRAAAVVASSCVMVRPIFTVQISGVAGTVSYICESGVKLA